MGPGKNNDGGDGDKKKSKSLKTAYDHWVMKKDTAVNTGRESIRLRSRNQPKLSVETDENN